MGDSANQGILKKTDREKRYIKFLTYSLTDPISRAFRTMLIILKKRLGYVYLLLMFFTSGITIVMTKTLLLGRMNPFHILTFTSFIGILVLIIFNYKKGARRLMESKMGLGWLIVAAITGFSFYEITFNMALQYMSVTQTIIIYYTNPIFLYFAGVLFLGKGRQKAVNKKVVLGILLSFAGIYFVVTGGRFTVFPMNIGIVYILLAIISITIFVILGKKKEIPELQFLLMGQAISLVSGLFILTAVGWWIIPNLHELGYIILIAVVYNILNMVFYIKTIQFLSVERLSTLTYISPIVTSGLAMLLLGEPLLVTTVIGLAMVILGNIVASYRNPSGQLL